MVNCNSGYENSVEVSDVPIKGWFQWMDGKYRKTKDPNWNQAEAERLGLVGNVPPPVYRVFSSTRKPNPVEEIHKREADLILASRSHGD